MKDEIIIGVDEVGRGCLAGPVLAAAVAIPHGMTLKFKDSKKQTENARQLNYKLIKKYAISVRLGAASPSEIDNINILRATMLAMKRAIEKLDYKDKTILVDGLHLPTIDSCNLKAVVKGDQNYNQIAAASIVAKVVRDYLMVRLSRAHPKYLFEKHKGYPTKDHIAAINNYGILPVHRKTFRPVLKFLEQKCQL